jgi:chorismate mutase
MRHNGVSGVAGWADQPLVPEGQIRQIKAQGKPLCAFFIFWRRGEQSMMVRGVRGAITVDEDSAEAIWSGTREMLQALIAANGINEADVASAIFTTTPDLTAAYPARAARDLGWQQTALMGMQEMAVPGGLERCIRVLIHWNTAKQIDELQHVFLRGAVVLRPDLADVEATKNNLNGRNEQ